MTGQVFKKPEKHREEYPSGRDPEPISPPTVSASKVDDDSYDELLDEIDGVLEENAEQFVQGFVQRGGE